jgi:hypothetical protein
LGTRPVLAGNSYPLTVNRGARAAAHRGTPVARMSWTNGSPARFLSSSSPAVKTMGATGRPSRRLRMRRRTVAILSTRGSAREAGSNLGLCTSPFQTPHSMCCPDPGFTKEPGWGEPVRARMRD